MTRMNYIAQPSRTTLDAIQGIVQASGIETMDVAAAYMTSSGVHDLIGRVSATLGDAWKGVNKRWITSFDYCRTDPVALAALLSVPRSSVRIHDPHVCLTHHGMPKVPFHPKAFLFRSDQRDYVLAGSGNVSRSGLSKGIEIGLVMAVNRTRPNEPTSAVAIKALRAWFLTTWNNATLLDVPLLENYNKLFESVSNLKCPVPTEDDLASSDSGSWSLSSKDLQKLRVCRHFWIEAGNITKNRGPHLPGNQLMMKRLSRVFFGFNPTAVHENTHIGDVDIYFDKGALAQYSLTYSDNKMDKLVLPIPGSDGPKSYDGECLLFRRMTPNVFRLTLGSRSERATWLKSSKAIDGAFKMKSGSREWGVF
jgi:HKD family nuclease